jgi:CDP-6-deoxy-D-xylo-4-hexulose-3-dehydrase
MIPLMKYAFPKEYETRQALAEYILKADRLSMDIQCSEFEKAFATRQQRKHAVLVNSGGSANLALLQALKNQGVLRDGDKIGFSALTWSTNTMPIFQLGLVPVPVDCSVRTLNVMSEDLLHVLEVHDLKAFFITNALGFTGDLDRMRDVCADRGILLLEDNCESLGTELPDGLAGNFGLASTFSFYVAHHLSTIEGGMICTDDDDLARMLRIVRANGWDRNLKPLEQVELRKQYDITSEFEAKYTFYDLAYNIRPTEITGFLGLFQLQFLDENIAAREANWHKVKEAIARNPDLLLVEHAHIKRLSAFAIPVICVNAEQRNRYAGKFLEAGIEIRPMIAGNIQLQPFYRKYGSVFSDLEGADFLHHHSFYCGNYAELTSKDLELICACLINY